MAAFDTGCESLVDSKECKTSFWPFRFAGPQGPHHNPPWAFTPERLLFSPVSNLILGIAEYISRGDRATSPSKAIRQKTNPLGYFGSASPLSLIKNRKQEPSGYTGAKENAPLKSLAKHSSISRKLHSLRKGECERDAGDD
jgi:hypothetical protein